MTLDLAQIQQEIKQLKESVHHLEELLQQLGDDSMPRDQNSPEEQLEVLPKLVEAIARAKEHILALPEDWDGEGGKPISQATFLRAEQFLEKLAETFGERFEIPYILPGPDASIDVHWKTEKYFLLVNIPESEDTPIAIAGEDREQNTLKLSLKENTFISALSAVLKPWLEMMA